MDVLNGQNDVFKPSYFVSCILTVFESFIRSHDLYMLIVGIVLICALFVQLADRPVFKICTTEVRS